MSGGIPRGYRQWPAAAAVLLVACQIDFSGLSNILDQDPTYLSLPGRQIAKGRFSSVNVDGTDAHGAYLVAFDVAETPARLALLPFDGGTGCRTGRADLYQTSPFGTRSSLVPYEQFTEKLSDGTRRLHFVNAACEEPLLPIENDTHFALTPPASAPFDDPPGFLVLTNAGDLLFLEPWVPKQIKVATGASSVQFADKKIWSIEKVVDPKTGEVTGSQVVVRDYSFRELARFGTQVTQLTVTPNTPARAAFIDAAARASETPPSVAVVVPPREAPSATGAAFDPAITGTPGDLYVVSTALEEPKLIDSDACSAGFQSGWHGLNYFSPCETSELVLYGSAEESGQRSTVGAKKYILRKSVIGPPVIQFSGNDAYVFFLANDDNLRAKNGALWGGQIGSSMQHLGDNLLLARSATPQIAAHSGTFQFVVDFVTPSGGTTPVGNLVAWTAGPDTTQLATGVEEINGSFGIVNFATKAGVAVGDLVQIKSTSVTTPLAHGVPAGGAISDSTADGIAVLTDYDGSTGTLLVSSLDEIRFEAVASGVPVSGFDFIESLQGVGYLHADPKTGISTLGVRVIETGDTFDIGIQASEWTEIGWPEPGILYVAPPGDREGIWFAALK